MRTGGESRKAFCIQGDAYTEPGKLSLISKLLHCLSPLLFLIMTLAIKLKHLELQVSFLQK